MNSRKNPSPHSLVFSLLLSATLGASFSGCSSLFRRGESEDAAENGAKMAENADRYEAMEAAADSSGELKDKKIRSLESTVETLNGRIRELEGKLQAAQNRPNLDANLGKSEPKNRQKTAAIAPSVATNDPGAGFANDANVRGFQQGKILFDQEKYPEAILALSAFLEANENHALAGTAQYYIAESYYRQSDFGVADQEFQKLAIRYPTSARMSWALLRLSDCAERTGRADEARRYRLQAEGLYAKSPALKDPAFRPTGTAIAAPAQTTAPIATAPDAPEGAAAMPSLAIEKPTPPTAPRLDGDLDAPPGAGL